MVACDKNVVILDYDILETPFTYDLEEIKISQEGEIRIVGGRTWDIGFICSTQDFEKYTVETISDKSIHTGVFFDDLFICGGVNRNLYQLDNELEALKQLSLNNEAGPAVINGMAKVQSKVLVVGGKNYNHGRIFCIDSNLQIDTVFELENQLNDIYATDDIILAVGYGQVLKYSIENRRWRQQEVSGDNFSSVYIFEKEAWVCGYDGSIRKSIDCGKNWIEILDNRELLSGGESLNDILFLDNKNGISVGDEGLIIITNNGGKSWSKMDFDRTTNLNAILHHNGHYYVVGDEGLIVKI